MKKLDLEQMEKIEGGYPSLDQGCQAYGWAIAVGSGAAPGSAEFYIMASIGYSACWESMF